MGRGEGSRSPLHSRAAGARLGRRAGTAGPPRLAGLVGHARDGRAERGSPHRPLPARAAAGRGATFTGAARLRPAPRGEPRPGPAPHRIGPAGRCDRVVAGRPRAGCPRGPPTNPTQLCLSLHLAPSTWRTHAAPGARPSRTAPSRCFCPCPAPPTRHAATGITRPPTTPPRAKPSRTATPRSSPAPASGRLAPRRGGA